MTFDRRARRVRPTALGVMLIGGAAAALFANPAAAAGFGNLVTTVSCSVTGANWCISGNNTSSGIGVIGTSKTGTGLRGTSTSQYGLKATSVSNIAILAQTTSGSTAVSATGGSGYGVSGTSTSGGAGVIGISPSTIGVYGDATDTTSDSSKGVFGYSNNGFGVYGYSPLRTVTGSRVSAAISGWSECRRRVPVLRRCRPAARILRWRSAIRRAETASM